DKVPKFSGTADFPGDVIVIGGIVQAVWSIPTGVDCIQRYERISARRAGRKNEADQQCGHEKNSARRKHQLLLTMNLVEMRSGGLAQRISDVGRECRGRGRMSGL